MSLIFSIHSLVRDFRFQGKQYEEVKINWFVADRKAPLADYAALIQDYSQLGEEERVFPEEYVNEQFSLQEAESLRAYLDRQQTTAPRPSAAGPDPFFQLALIPALKN